MSLVFEKIICQIILYFTNFVDIDRNPVMWKSPMIESSFCCLSLETVGKIFLTFELLAFPFTTFDDYVKFNDDSKYFINTCVINWSNVILIIFGQKSSIHFFLENCYYTIFFLAGIFALVGIVQVNILISFKLIFYKLSNYYQDSYFLAKTFKNDSLRHLITFRCCVRDNNLHFFVSLHHIHRRFLPIDSHPDINH